MKLMNEKVKVSKAADIGSLLRVHQMPQLSNPRLMNTVISVETSI